MIKKGKTSTRSTKSTKKTQPTEIVESQGSNSSYIYLAIIVVVIITAVVLMVMDKFKPAQEQQMVQTQQQKQSATIDDSDKLIARVGELIVIKEGEQPTVATVQNAELLKVDNPEFYKNAVNGDRLLIWSDKAVLYSTSKDKLLAVMPISQPVTDSNASSTTATTSEMTEENSTTTEMDPTATVEEENPIIQVRNGTRVAGLAGKMSTFLKSHDLPIAVVSDAVGKSYATTTIYRLTDEQKPATEEVLTNVLGAEISTNLPSNETTASGDYVIIIGSDYAE